MWWAAAVAIVVMGVSGSGKSTVAAAVAEALGRPYLDADDLHPVENLAKLGAGIALTDADRMPWLDAVAAWILAHPRSVVACSALRRPYRDRLRSVGGSVWFLHLDPPVDVLRARLAVRREHFMPASLLPDQLATLEPLQADEPGLRVGDGAEVQRLVILVVDRAAGAAW